MLSVFKGYRPSLFRVIYILFGFTLVWLMGMFYYSNAMLLKHNQENIIHEVDLLAHQVLNEFVVGNTPKMVSLVRSSGFTPHLSSPKDAKVLARSRVGLGNIAIFQSRDRYGFSLEYLDDIFSATKKFEVDFLGRHLINIIIFLGILIVLVIFGLLLAILHPLKLLRKSLEEFGSGNYKTRLKIPNEAEQALLAETFNQMADKISRLMQMRELILRNIGHELKTPIAKARLALELMEDNPQKAMVLRCIRSLNSLSDKILTLEKAQSAEINSNNAQGLLHIEQFNISHLILASLEDILQNEEEIRVEIIEGFAVRGDLDLLCVCVKNLVENAFKYKSGGAVEILTLKRNGENVLCVRNEGEALEQDISYYLEPFLRENKHRLIQGYGLGLSIVKEVLILHRFMLEYNYVDGKHHFYLVFREK